MRTVCLSELGEFELIHRLTSGLETRDDVVVSVGDDAAVLVPVAGERLVATVDAQVEGRHFLLSVTAPEAIGHKALAVNLSDIAAMGATPKWALISLLAPVETAVAVLDGVYRGMRELARGFDVAIVGGNVSSTDGPLTIDVALLGQVAAGRATLRSGAQVGDAVVVTGALGAAAAGVLTLSPAPHGAGPLDAATVRGARDAMERPWPLVREGEALARSGRVTAMLDVSDGLAADLAHLCEASGVGAVLDASAIPVHPAAHAVATVYHRDPLTLALNGGEDYQLLFTARPEDVSRLGETLATCGCACAVIGEIREAEAGLKMRDAAVALTALEPKGWDHLRQRPAARTEGI
ncbi:MAG TPA: thiamine-phosphate kinase [Ktedonobacterales bacterium]|nr:thiamine-phosphate kinase [Ktedonobacterales bacterium]